MHCPNIRAQVVGRGTKKQHRRSSGCWCGKPRCRHCWRQTATAARTGPPGSPPRTAGSDRGTRNLQYLTGSLLFLIPVHDTPSSVWHQRRRSSPVQHADCPSWHGSARDQPPPEFLLLLGVLKILQNSIREQPRGHIAERSKGGGTSQLLGMDDGANQLNLNFVLRVTPQLDEDRLELR